MAIFSFANPFSDFDCIFPSVIFLKVGPDKIYAYTHLRQLEIGSLLSVQA